MNPFDVFKITKKKSVDFSLGYIGETNPNWRNDLREQIIDDEDFMPKNKTEQMRKRKKKKMSLTQSSKSLS